jgi:hypothetical protein
LARRSGGDDDTSGRGCILRRCHEILNCRTALDRDGLVYRVRSCDSTEVIAQLSAPQ